MRQLARAGFERVTIATGYLAELIEAFFGDGSRYGIPIDYFREHEPLGTVGALSLIDGLDEDFLVMNGDVLTDSTTARCSTAIAAGGAAATIAAHAAHDPDLARRACTSPTSTTPAASPTTSRSRRSTSRRRWACTASRPACLEFIEPGGAARLPRSDPAADRAGEPCGRATHDYWLDIGRPDDYEQAQDEFEPSAPVPPGGVTREHPAPQLTRVLPCGSSYQRDRSPLPRDPGCGRRPRHDR